MERCQTDFHGMWTSQSLVAEPVPKSALQGHIHPKGQEGRTGSLTGIVKF